MIESMGRSSTWVFTSAVGLVAVVGQRPSADADPSADARVRRQEIQRAVAADPTSARLQKADLRAGIKSIIPRLTRGYEQARTRAPRIAGVINTKLTVLNDPRLGMMLTVTGFDTDGTLGESREFLACVTTTFEATVLPPIATRGRRDFIYPTTFSSQPVNNRDSGIVDVAAKAAAAGRWSEALARAEQGLTRTSLDGTFRRRLIETAGLSACQLKDEPKARHYFSMASPELEQRLEQTCLRVASIDLVK